MTTIELFTDDQKLYFTRKVYIASGDVESVQLHIDFCGAWDDFPVRTVTFTNDTTKISKDALMTYNRCIVPFEVLSKPGMLQVSVIANSTDGSKQKTSGMIKYRIDLGAELSDITLTPTMNVYQQFLSAIHDMEDPITQAMVNAIAEKNAELDAQFEALQSNCARPCDFTNKIHIITETGTSWTATQDCWLSVYIKGSIGHYAKVKVNGILAINHSIYTYNSSNTVESVLTPLYVKKGTVIEYESNVDNTHAENKASLDIYACAE